MKHDIITIIFIIKLKVGEIMHSYLRNKNGGILWAKIEVLAQVLSPLL